MSIAELLNARPGVSDCETEARGEQWVEVRGTYLRAPFVYQVSAEDDDAAVRSLYAKIIAEWDAGELKPAEEPPSE